jgi:hypothetical protein
VYGRNRTFITQPGGEVTVVHYVFKHARRYKVDFRHERLLPGLVLQGQKAIFDWMLERKRPLAELNFFRESCVRYNQKDALGAPRALLTVLLDPVRPSRGDRSRSEELLETLSTLTS